MVNTISTKDFSSLSILSQNLYLKLLLADTETVIIKNHLSKLEQLEELENKKFIISIDSGAEYFVVKSNALRKYLLIGTEIKDDKEIVYDEFTKNLEAVCNTLYSIYPRKQGKARGMQSLHIYLTKGKNVAGENRKIKLNHLQIDIAIKCYASECKDKEQQFIKEFSTFMNTPIVEYVEKTKQHYEEYMKSKYGEEWERVKFYYK